MSGIFIHPSADVQAVLDSAPAGSVIRLAPGEYRDKLLIRTPGLTLIGDGTDRTKLVRGDYAHKRDAEGREYNTFRTWTLAVCADGVTLRDLTVENDALRPELKGQEIALSVCADGFCAEDCVIRSTQDTLFLGPLPVDLIARYAGFLPEPLRRGGPCRQHLQNCRIEGTVDFIFGCGEALFEDCEIRSLFDPRGVGYATAPAHGWEQTEGFRFRRCVFSCAESVPAGSVYLARPWRDNGLCRFEDCSCGPHIAPAGFDPWGRSGREHTARFYETPPRPGRVPWVHTEA